MLKSIIAERDEVAGSRERTPSVRWALASLSLSMLLSSLGSSIANVGLPAFAQAFNTTFQGVQWIVLAYLLAITTLIVSVGRLGDMTGRRRLLLAGILLFTVASVLCGVAPTLWLLIAARAAQGLGAAVMMALTMAFIGETVPKEKTGSAMGLLGTMSAIGTALGPSLGGVLIAALSWRAIFLLNLPLGMVAFLLAHRHLPVDRQGPKTGSAGFDTVGTLLLALTLASYALAMTMGRGSFGPLNTALLLGASVGVGLFVLAEARSPSPLIRLAIFRDPELSASLAMSALVSTVMMATLVVGPFYLARALGLDAALVGLALSVGPVAAALTSVPAGRIADRFGVKRMTIVGLSGIAAGSFVLAMVPATLGIPGYIAPMVVITVGYALFQTANNTAVMTDIHADQRGVISGMLNLSRNLGLITGASVMGAVFTLASATTDITTARPEAVAAGMRITFAVAAALMVVALAIASVSRNSLDRRPLNNAKAETRLDEYTHTMKVAIIGASGKSGRFLVKECLEKGYEVVGLCRPVSVPKLDEFANKMTIVQGLGSDREVVRQAVEGCDGVITIIIAPGRGSTYATDTVRYVLEEAKDARLVFSGSDGASQILEGETRSFRNRLEIALGGGLAWLLGMATISNMVASTELIYASSTRWTVVRGPWLKKGESQGMPVAGSLGAPIVSAREVRRVDFARFMVAALADESLVGRTPVIARTRH